jgi:VWFA-related protein
VRSFITLVCALFLLTLMPAQRMNAQDRPELSDVPPLRVNSTLVFLDVTVVDKTGRPVVKGLTKDDFTIVEDKKPQRINSFEPPESHSVSSNADDENPESKAPVMIFVLDRLNSSIDEFAQIRDSLRAFLATQSAQFEFPAELMVIGNDSLEMVQGYTRSKEEMLYAVNHVQTVVPFKLQRSDFDGERAHQSIDALLQIAVQNTGVPGRKNIYWLGPGGPSLSRASYGPVLDMWKPYVHSAANLLVNARISLFVIFPPLKVEDRSAPTLGSILQVDRDSNLGNNAPFTGDVNFALFGKETGGGLFYNSNGLTNEMTESQQLGSHYYTLTYKPTNAEPDGKFRQIRVTLNDVNLRAITKEGYFATDKNAPVDPRKETVVHILEAAQSKVTFTALEMKVSDVVRHPETRTAQITVYLKPKNLGWVASGDGKKLATMTMAMVSLSGSKNILASKFEKVALWSTAEDPNQLAEDVRMRLTIPIPSKTQDVRIVMETAAGRIGAVDLDRKAIDAAPATTSQASANHSTQVGAQPH